MRPISAESLKTNHTFPLELRKGPSHPCCNSRSSPTHPFPLERKNEGPAHLQRSPVSSSQLEMRDPFPATSGKYSWCSHRISRGGALHRKGDRNSRVLPPFQQTPDDSVHSRGICFPCTTSSFTPRIYSHPGGTWDSPVGKSRGKASWESLQGKPQIP